MKISRYLGKCMHKFNKHGFSACLCKIYAIKNFVSFLWNFIIFFSVISCAKKSSRIPCISHKTYCTKDQERQNKIKYIMNSHVFRVHCETDNKVFCLSSLKLHKTRIENWLSNWSRTEIPMTGNL